MIIEEEISEVRLPELIHEAVHIAQEPVELKNGETALLEVITDFSQITLERKRFLAEQISMIAEEKASPSQESLQAILRQMENNSYDLYYVSGSNGNMVGYATVFPTEENHGCYINKIFTAVEHREKNVAKNILAKVQNDFDNVILVNVMPDPEMKPILDASYLRMGFKQKDDLTFVWQKKK